MGFWHIYMGIYGGGEAAAVLTGSGLLRTGQITQHGVSSGQIVSHGIAAGKVSG